MTRPSAAMHPKQVEPEDPLELCRVGLMTDDDTTSAMAECLVEEYLRLGYHPNQLLALFRNPFYSGLHLVLERRGEEYVRGIIGETWAKWGRTCVWDSTQPTGAASGRAKVSAAQPDPAAGGERTNQNP